MSVFGLARPAVAQHSPAGLGPGRRSVLLLAGPDVGEGAAGLIRVLAETLPLQGWQVQVAVAGAARRLSLLRAVEIVRLHGPEPAEAAALPGLLALLRRSCPDVVHALGSIAFRLVGSALAVSAGGRTGRADRAGGAPGVVTSVFSVRDVHALAAARRPTLAHRGRGTGWPLVVTPADGLRRRLAEAGYPSQGVEVIPPPWIRPPRGHDPLAVRSALGLPPPDSGASRADGDSRCADGPVVLTLPAVGRASGVEHVVWAAAILAQMWPDIRVVIPGDTPEARRMVRFCRSFAMPHLVAATGEEPGAEALPAVADLFVAAPDAQGDLAPLLWAAGAGLPVVVPERVALDGMAPPLRPVFAPSARPRVLAAAILKAVRNLRALREDALAAAAVLRERHEPAVIAQRYVAVYEHAITRARAAASSSS